MIRITFHGHACFSIENDKYYIIIDPFITNNPKSDIKVEDIKVTHILLTHGHDDHFGDTIELAKKNDALIIAPNELGIYCEHKGLQVHRMHIGGGFKFDFGRVKLTQALHGSCIVENNNIICTGNPCGFIIEIEGKSIYHAGDTGLFSDMKLIGDMHELDLALLPIGDNFVMGPEDAVIAAKMLNPKLIVPMHYNTFPLIEQSGEEFINELKKIDLSGRIMEPGEFIEF